MKFGEKYELLESITTGGVETFVANDKVRGERVLVHILECEAQKPNQPTVQWVLEAFRHLAPEPAALVLETGRYSGTLYAYLVTKMPDEAALTRWVQSYKTQARETQEIPVPAPRPTAESEAQTANMATKEPSRFSAPTPQAEPVLPSAVAKVPQPVAKVKSAADLSAVQPAPNWDAITSPRSPAKAEPNSGNSESPFSFAFETPNVPSETNSPVANNSPKPGEFTNFFQGPFRVQGPSETPGAPSPPIEPPRKSVGEFTAMFNAPRTAEPPPEAGVAGNEPAGSFTQLFSKPRDSSPISSGNAIPASNVVQGPVEDAFSAFPEPQKQPFVPPLPPSFATPKPPIVPVPMPIVAAPPSVFPLPPLPNPVMNPLPSPAVSPSQGATNAFNHFPSAPTPVQPPPPSAPSAYTQIISVKSRAGSAGAQKEASNSAGSLPSFSAAPAPPMPKIAAPPAPKAPDAATSQPPFSYWPLILTLTVLFFIAVLLVLYFALKH
jgi:hypothetical protein